MMTICVLGGFVDGFYDYSQAKPPRCSTFIFVQFSPNFV